MNDVSKTQEEFSDKMTSSLVSLGYTVDHIEFVNEGVLKVWLSAKDGIPVTGQKPYIVLCQTHELTMGARRHRHNYYFWQEGLAKLANPDFWLRRGGDLRGALSDAELAYRRQYNSSHSDANITYHRQYDASHREERLTRQAAYDASHREERLTRMAAYYDSNREEILACASKIWSNGTETLKWSTLQTRARRKWHMTKSDLLAAGWHPLN